MYFFLKSCKQKDQALEVLLV